MKFTKDLTFFNKNGIGYGFSWDETNEIWTGTIFLEPVSKGLFETEKIMVMQKCVIKEESQETDFSNSVKTYDYCYPATDSSISSETEYYEFRWDSDINEVDEIKMFGFDRSPCPPEDSSALTYHEYNCPYISFYDNVDIKNLTSNPINDTPIDTTIGNIHTKTYTKNASWSNTFADINICFCNKDDDYSTFRRDLFLYYKTAGAETKVGHFIICAKSIEEDERLTAMCHNLGYDINNIDFSIFQDSDIKEQLIDNKLMNLKKKEILMEGHNIYSYIGSYKSLINAIRFFGYDNVTIKEWWKNIDIESENYGKCFTASSYSLIDHEVIHYDTNVVLPSKKYKKTGMLSLVYNINKINNLKAGYYGHEYPLTDESFDYTIEEAVIKLYGLKRKLETVFLPINTKIIDVVGEASSFYVSTIRHNMSQNIMFYSNNMNNTTSVTFSVCGSDDGCFYLEDMRPFGIHSKNINSGSGNSMVGVQRIGSAQFVGDYKSLYDSQYISGVNELGNLELTNYNTNWDSVNNNYSTNSENEYAYLAGGENIKITGGLQDIQGVQRLIQCVPLQGYQGIQGVVSPYNMIGNSLFGVSGNNVANCEPWIYYIQANTGNYGNYYLAEFSSYYPNLNMNYRKYNDFETDENTHLPDNENIPIGALVELKIDEKDVTWNTAYFNWDFVGNISWIYINTYVSNISRAEWHIYKSADENPEFDTLICGMLLYGYGDIGVVLPYVGKYNIELKLFDYNNNVISIIKKDAITVYPREVEFSGWCKMKTNLIDWYSDAAWENLSTEWNFPYENTVTWNELKSSEFCGMDRGSFIGQYADTEIADEKMLIYNFEDETNNGYSILEDNRGSYFWNNLDVSWQDMNHLWWDAMCITGDIPCYFIFGYFDNAGEPTNSPNYQDNIKGKYLEIVDSNNNLGSFKFPNSSGSELNYIADVVKSLNESNNPVLSKFFYSYVWEDYSTDNNNLQIPAGFHIVATSKNHGRNGDIKFVDIVSSSYYAYVDNNNILHARRDPNNKQLKFYTNSVECNPNWNDMVCINNITEIPAYTDVNFNYTNCRILGKTNPKWKFTNLNTNTSFTSSNKNYHRMFKEKGCWEISLTLNDSNGNTYNAKRNILKII